MITFLDGPAADCPGLELCRAPVFLRVVRDPATGEWDALDQLCDGPRRAELVYAYRRTGDGVGWAHIDYTDRATGRRRGRTFMAAEYRHWPDQPDDATLRDPALWRAWCLKQVQGEKEGKHA